MAEYADVASRCSMRTPDNVLASRWLASDPDHKYSRSNGGGCDRPGAVRRNGAATDHRVAPL